MIHPKVQRAQECARFFRSLGWNALPSRSDRKGPAMASFADFWTQPLPDEVYDAWFAENIQIMTGAHWQLCVVDCDGDEAQTVWRAMCAVHSSRPPKTWIARTGGGGEHWYFTLPDGLESCPSRRLWGVWDTFAGSRHQGDWQSHKEVRLLADNALVVAPPSTHVTTGKPYKWAELPYRLDRPAPAPAWLINAQALQTPRCQARVLPFRLEGPKKLSGGPLRRSYSRDDVLGAIPDMAALAASWGLRLASRAPNPKGWIACHAIDREDKRPSASFHPQWGIYVEAREGEKLSLFDLAVRLGAYPDWKTAMDDLARTYAGAS